MATRHILSCPNCGEELLVDVEPQAGGTVQDNLILVDHRRPDAAPTPAEVEVPVTPAADATEPEVVATPAAEAHAAATGVDLTQVEGTGVDGTIKKSDVEAAAAATEEAPSA